MVPQYNKSNSTKNNFQCLNKYLIDIVHYIIIILYFKIEIRYTYIDTNYSLILNVHHNKYATRNTKPVKER